MTKSQFLKIVAMIVAVAALVCVFAACVGDGEKVTIKEYQVKEAEFAVGDTFTKSSITIQAVKTDGTVGIVPVDSADKVVFPNNYKETLKLEKDISDGSEVWKFTTAGTYNITVNYLGDEIAVEIVVK